MMVDATIQLLAYLGMLSSVEQEKGGYVQFAPTSIAVLAAGDGGCALIASARGEIGSMVFLTIGGSQGVVRTQALPPRGPGLGDILAGRDLDRDSINDYVVVEEREARSAISAYSCVAGRKIFSTDGKAPFGTINHLVWTDDVDSDNISDILAVGYAELWLLSGASGEVIAHRPSIEGVGSQGYAVLAEDYDGDGVRDFAFLVGGFWGKERFG